MIGSRSEIFSVKSEPAARLARAVGVAWRNIWRNTHRTWITLAAVGLNTAVLIVALAQMRGILWHFTANAVNVVTGEVQIHHPDYLGLRSMYDVMDEPEQLLGTFRRRDIPAAARSYGYGLLALESKSAGAQFWGVDPLQERAVCTLSGKMDRGSYLGPLAAMEVVLGCKLARSLGADAGSEIVAVVQAADGSMGNEIFTVAGIFQAAGERIDRAAAVLHRADFERLFVSGGRVHEIVLNTRGRIPLAAVAAAAAEIAPRGQARTWEELLPVVVEMIRTSAFGISIFTCLFYVAAGLGVLNTMLMATFERFHEFGVVKALGASGWHIVRGVMLEALMLGVAGGLAGLAVGLAGACYLQIYGLDTRLFVSGQASLAGVAFDPVWRARLTLDAVVRPVVLMWPVCMAASLYPAVIAARLDPVKTMQHV
jgi:ABC-type lipoprotein release transport system permease subunit